MEQNYNNGQNDFLWTLLANPADDAHTYNYNLQRLVNDFPQSGILQALLAHSSDQKNLKQASVYFNARSLYKLINSPSSLIGVGDEKIIVQNGIRPADFTAYVHHNGEAEPIVNENYFSAPVATGTEETAQYIPEAEHEATSAENTGHQLTEEITETLNTHPTENIIENIHPEGHLIPADTHHTETHIPADELVENIHTDEPVTPSYEHQPVIETPVEDQPVVGAHTEEELLPPPAQAVHQETTPVEEIQQEHEEPGEHTGILNDIPFIEPIINYAQGLGRKMAPDTEVETPPEGQTPVASSEASHVQEEVHHESVSEHIIEESFTPPPVSDEHIPVEHVGAEHNEFIEPHVQEHHHEEVPQQTEVHIPQAESPAGHNIEEETFDEITGIDNIDIEPDIISNIAATDYFTFDRAFGAHKDPEPVNEAPQTETVSQQAEEAEQQDLSKYHDEKMPYSFLWWLDKTRKEHSGIYQPYIAPENTEPVNKRNTKSVVVELEQQYYENIFHITSVEELDKSVPHPPYAPPVQEHKRKEQSIIDRFIEEEPQIRPQSSDKLDNENKAKKSSEDRDELVSETLAAIYSDQMLYHKAIASYKKLMLRFPEKSRYFAAKIEQLEKKTN